MYKCYWIIGKEHMNLIVIDEDGYSVWWSKIEYLIPERGKPSTWFPVGWKY